MEEKFHGILKRKIHEFITLVYAVSKEFPSHEKFGVTSQLLRASMSIMLNYVEGYARRRDKVKLNFYEISHGSSQECKYLLYFAYTQSWIIEKDYVYALALINEIAKMLWSTVELLEQKIDV